MTNHAADPSTDPSAHRQRLLDDDRLTAMGLLIEAFTGIHERVERELESLGLGMSSFEIMIRLARSPEHRLRMTELATQSTLTNSGLTRVIDRLSAAGLVTREPCDTDRRGWYAVLTEAGLTKLTAVLPDHLATVERSFTGVLGPDHLPTFLAALRQLRVEVRPGSDPVVAAALSDG